MMGGESIVKCLRLIAVVVLPAAFLTSMWFGWRYNFELAHMAKRELATCPTAAPQFVVVTIKGSSQCIEARSASRFQQAEQLGQLALAVGAICFVFLFVDRKLKARNAPNQ